MPYGIISDDLLGHLKSRAKGNNVSDRIDFEPEWCANQHEYPCDIECDCAEPEDLFTVSVIIEGALDEEFSVSSGGYESNICGWVVEFLESQNVPNYWVMVSDQCGNLVCESESGV
jgi:hypothetical protein